MLSANVVLFTALAYVALLFVVAFFSDRRARRGWLGLVRSPIVYTLSISVYCTSWTFYGAVGSAARNGLEFATIYLGPTLVFVGWWFLLRKLVRIGRVHRASSIADLISSRYGKSMSLAVLVTVIAVIGTTPYIALQLKAVTTSFQVVASTTHTALLGIPEADLDLRTGFWVAVGMAVFTILFGTRNIDANEHHHGVVAAIALEALVKLFALIAVGLYVVFAIGGGVGEVFALPASAKVLGAEVFGPRWVALTFLSATAIVCLPRQFQITVVENADEEHLRTAAWLFPLYLFLTCLFTLPIAITGLATMPAGSNPDMYVLTLPMLHDRSALSLLVFIGGFSSATSMVIVASIALSIMVSNHIVMPIALRLAWLSRGVSGDVKSLLLVSRRISIALILSLGFVYFVFSAHSDALAKIGLIAFAGVAQFLPCLIGGLYWHRASKGGAFAGLLIGFVTWAYTLLLPSFEGGAVPASLFSDGPWGIALLRPEALFGAGGMDPLVHALFWSLSLNAGLFVLISLIKDQNPLERLQSTLFVDVFRNPADKESRFIHRSAAIDDLFVLAQRILGAEQAYLLFRDYARRQGIEEGLPRPSTEFIAQLERQFAGSIGAASARVMISQVVTGETISLGEMMRLVDETQQVIEYSQQLEQKSQQLQVTARQLREANERLRLLDAQKDDFLSQVSHEVRTPMASIRSFSEILLETRDLESEQATRFLSIIHDETLRLTRLLDEILDLSHLERGELAWSLQPLDAEAVLDRAIETCRGMAASADVQLVVGPRAGSVRVMGHEDRLNQVFINLISNAIKHNRSRAPVVTVSSAIAEGRYQVTFEDNGEGVPAEARDRIFTKFSRAWTQSRPRDAGAGLGLAISRAIARKMHGDVELLPAGRPGSGVGARFRVSLPLARGQAAPAGELERRAGE
ncbi:Na+/proline symporter [Tistlia consotensis]|uniref:histidine kinase n=1 Tax=Tistlia consotensis USBA 355 TaxID=560819 RepID=A0A1Y6CD68_9PROT|nr:sensor histidine kinase [Tistlia consotensis]SMF55321.1 Na+/proline symporter [Tistlia consotensis USBA 355]SNR88197.1 Na+/proline symporter [Tistlia consotensis]